MAIRSLATRRQKYFELDEDNSVAELRQIPTISLSWSNGSGSNSGRDQSLTEKSHKSTDDLQPNHESDAPKQYNIIPKPFLKRLWAKLVTKKRKQTDDGTARIGIAASPKQYLRDSKRTSSKEGKLLRQSRAQKKRLKLLTICEDEEFDTGLHEC